MFLKKLIIFFLILVIQTLSLSRAYSNTDDKDQAKELISKITQNVSVQNPTEISEAINQLANYKYKEVGIVLVNQISLQLDKNKPNSYIINAALTSLEEVGNKDTESLLREEKWGQDFEQIINTKLGESIAQHIIPAFEKSMGEMSSRTEPLPALYQISSSKKTDNSSPASLKKEEESSAKLNSSFSDDTQKGETESYEQWMERLTIRDQAMAILNDVKSDILNDRIYTDSNSDKASKEKTLSQSFSVFGRTEEVNNVIDILTRIKSRSPVLLGPSGSGKTTVVSKVAEMIVKGQISKASIYDHLRTSMILEVSPASISQIAQSDIPSAQAAAMTTFFKSVLAVQKKYNQKIIIFMDEIHTLNDGQAEAMKPFLDSLHHEIYLIGASTFPEFEQKFKNNEALQRRFSPVSVQELPMDQIIQVIEKSWQPLLKVSYNTEFTKQAVETLVKKSISLKNPGGAIDTAIKFMQDIAINARRNSSENSSTITIEEKQVHDFLQNNLKYPSDPRDGPNFKSHLDQWEKQINNEVLGQKRVVAHIVEALGLLLKDDHKRVSPVLLLGPTGVGKTLLANTVAKVVFNNPRAVLEIDATALKTGGYSLNSLFGAPNGVVSSDKTSGRLMEWLGDPAQGKNGGVLIINEIERASSDLWERLMELFDRGVVAGGDGKERVVNNLLIILTSNKGHEILYPKGMSLWDKKEIQNHLNSFSQENLKSLFSDLDPAILGRIDKVDLMNPIDKDLTKKIITQTINNWVKQYEEMYSVKFKIAEDFADKITELSFDILTGARPIARNINSNLSKAINAAFSHWTLERGDEIAIDLETLNNKIYMNVTNNKDSVRTESTFLLKTHPLDDPELLQKINNLDRMNDRIIGQSEMVDSIKDAVVSHYSNKDRKRPLSIALIGSTGIGKTETGKALAQIWYGHEDRASVIPLGHITYSGELNNIFGSPAGHIGSDQVSLFEQSLRDNAQGGVIIFDEFSNMGFAGNKDKSLKTTLLQSFYTIMDEGVWTSASTQKKYDLSKYIFLFTGNDGEEFFDNTLSDELNELKWSKLKEKNIINKVLLKSGVPEAFLGRLSNTILAKPLTQTDIYKISERFLAPFVQDLQSRGIKFIIDDNSKKQLARISSLGMGARSIRNFIDTVLTGFINKLILQSKHRSENLFEVYIKISDNFFNDETPYTETKEEIKRKVSLNITGKSQKGTVLFTEEKNITNNFKNHGLRVTKASAKQTAIHEAGHAIVYQILNNDSLIEYIDMRAAGNALGSVAFSRSEIISTSQSKQKIISDVAVLIAGRLAEIHGGYELNTGWMSDLKQVQKLMTDFLKGLSEGYKLGNKMTKEDSQEIFNKAKDLTNSILNENKKTLNKLADILVEKPFMDGSDFRKFMESENSQNNKADKNKKLLRNFEYLEKLNAVVWANDDQLSAKFLKENPLSEELLEQNEKEIKQNIIRLILQNGKKTLQILLKTLQEKYWSNHPELIEAVIREGDQDVLKALDEYTLKKDHWKNNPRLIELSQGKEVTVENLKKGLKKEESTCF